MMRAAYKDVLEFLAGSALAWGVIASIYFLGFGLSAYVSN
jgi:hypothetical protein